jgi:hypothetical protein
VRHHHADLAHRLVAAGLREALAHDVADAQHHVPKEFRLAHARALEHPARLGVDLAQPDGDVLVAGIEPAVELGVADGRRDRVGVGVAMARDVDARWSGDASRVKLLAARPILGRARQEKATPIQEGGPGEGVRSGPRRGIRTQRARGSPALRRFGEMRQRNVLTVGLG